MRDTVASIGGKLQRFVASKDKSTYVDKFLRRGRLAVGMRPRVPTYTDRVDAERARFRNELDVNALPGIFHYWSHTHLRSLFTGFGVDHPDDWFARHLFEAAQADAVRPHCFASIGAGNCDTEVRVAQRLLALGLDDFTIECLDLSAEMLQRGRVLADAAGVAHCLRFTVADLNDWQPVRLYCGIMANQSLHHIVNLEQLFTTVQLALAYDGMFVVSDIIGRNGHLRWPEALAAVHAFWRELTPAQRYNQQLQRHEALYENWDCSTEGFEGVRAQDILPLLLARFHFHRYIGFGNVIDPFVDRAFGHNLDPGSAVDRAFIDRVHAFDEAGFANGSLTPTHLFAVLTSRVLPGALHARGLTPQASVRDPDAAPRLDPVPSR